MAAKPPSFTIKRHENHYDLVAQDGTTLVCGLETVEQTNDLLAKMMAQGARLKAEKDNSMAALLQSVGGAKQ